MSAGVAAYAPSGVGVGAPGRAGLACAALGAVAAHGMLLAVLFWQPPDSGAEAAGSGGLQVSLGPAGGAPGAVGAVLPEVEQALAPADTRETPPPELLTESAPVPPAQAAPVTPKIEAERVQEVTPETATKAVAAQAEALTPEVETPQAMQAVRRPAAEVAPEPAAVQAPETPEETAAAAVADAAPEPADVQAQPPAPEPAAAQAVQTARQAEAGPTAAPRVSPPPRPKPARDGDETPSAAAKAAPTTAAAGAAGRSGAGQRATVGAGDDTAGGGDPGARADYAARIAAWLARNQYYPRAAQRLRAEGVGVVWFRMDASGRVTAQRVVASTGRPMLDEAIEETLRRAQPLPPIPPELGMKRIEFSVPVRFRLR